MRPKMLRSTKCGEYNVASSGWQRRWHCPLRRRNQMRGGYAQFLGAPVYLISATHPASSYCASQHDTLTGSPYTAKFQNIAYLSLSVNMASKWTPEIQTAMFLALIKAGGSTTRATFDEVAAQLNAGLTGESFRYVATPSFLFFHILSYLVSSSSNPQRWLSPCLHEIVSFHVEPLDSGR